MEGSLLTNSSSASAKLTVSAFDGAVPADDVLAVNWISAEGSQAQEC